MILQTVRIDGKMEISEHRHWFQERERRLSMPDDDTGKGWLQYDEETACRCGWI